MSSKSDEEISLEYDTPRYCSFKSTPNPIDVAPLKQRLVIIDGANLLHLTKKATNAIPGASNLDDTKRDGLILLQLANYFDYYGFKVCISLRPDYMRYVSNPEVVRELISLGYVSISKNEDKEDDDRAALGQAYKIGAVIVTNDKYRNHHGYGLTVKDNLCPVEIVNPNRNANEWPHYMFMKPLEHFYFVNPERDLYYKRAVEEEELHAVNPISSNMLRNLFKFVCCVGWYQMKGAWSNEFVKEAYRLPIDCKYLRENKRYANPYVYFRPNEVDQSIVKRNEESTANRNNNAA